MQMVLKVSNAIKYATSYPPTWASSINNMFRTTPTFSWYKNILQQQKHVCLKECSRRYMGHTVRIILTQDVSDGKLYTGDIATVKAGYARNYLIPQKKAVYATRQNFIKLNIKDPELETAEERQARLDREAVAGSDKDLKAADILRRYLQNKVLKIWRNVDAATGTDVNTIKPGMVDAKAIRQKLDKQLRIRLEPYEHVHVYKEPVDHDEMTEKQLNELVANTEIFGTDREKACTNQIKMLGQYVARISLRGGYDIPLKFEIVKR